MEEKYKFSEDPQDIINYRGHTLHRIISTRCIRHPEGHYDIEAGERGGFVESMRNLSQEGESWIMHDAKVMDYACVKDNACIIDCAVVMGCAIIGEFARVRGEALITGDSYLSGNVSVAHNAVIGGDANISGNCFIGGDVNISGRVTIDSRDATFCDDVIITGSVKITAKITAQDNVKIIGPDIDSFRTLYLNRDGEFGRGSIIREPFDYFSSYNQWSSNRLITYVRNTGIWCTGCFRGTGMELIAKAYNDSYMKGECFRKLVKYAEDICHIRETVPETVTKPWPMFKEWLFTKIYKMKP